MRRTISSCATLILAGAMLVAIVGSTTPAAADGPGAGPSWLVSLGDSAISGEGGRWAGNTNWPSGHVDALGENAYDEAGGVGTITHIGGLCVDVQFGNTADGTPIQLAGCNGSTAQKWEMRTDGSVRALGRCMTVVGPPNGTAVQLWWCTGARSQRWRRSGSGILNANYEMCLHVPGTPAAQVQLKLDTCVYNTRQTFTTPDTFEQIAGCHRSRSAAVHIDRSSSRFTDDPRVVNTMNFACSGAKTYTEEYEAGTNYKPGIDFAPTPPGLPASHKGQAQLLYDFAKTHNVKAVALMIGANDLGFSTFVRTCITDFLLTALLPSGAGDVCRDDDDLVWRLHKENLDLLKGNIKQAIWNIEIAMTQAGYAVSDWTLFVHTYWAILPISVGLRYTAENYDRQELGGCGVWNGDADWATWHVFTGLNNAVRGAVKDLNRTNVKLVELDKITQNHLLCQNSVRLLEDTGFVQWTQPGVADAVEWVNQARVSPAIRDFVKHKTGYELDIDDPAYQAQEGAHANYWGQLAMRNCLRQAYNYDPNQMKPQPRDVDCRPAGGLNQFGEPNISLMPPHPVPLVQCESDNEQMICNAHNIGTAPAASIAWRIDGQARARFNNQDLIVFGCTGGRHYQFEADMTGNGVTETGADDLDCDDNDDDHHPK
jgi:hypothetical protein